MVNGFNTACLSNDFRGFLLPTQAATYSHKNKKKFLLLMLIAAVEANGEWEVISLSRNFIGEFLYIESYKEGGKLKTFLRDVCNLSKLFAN